jgi:hypothetical protein
VQSQDGTAAVLTSPASTAAELPRAACGRIADVAGEPQHDPEKWNPVFRKDHAPSKS